MSDSPEDFAKKIKKKLERARKADNVAKESWEEVYDDFRDMISATLQADRPTRNNPHDKAYDNFGESKIAIMLFMDIIDYSKLETNERQRDAIHTLNETVRAALHRASCNLDDVICLPTGDGMCLCFTDPYKPLLVAEAIHQTLLGLGSSMKLRMGIHSGGVVRVTDLKGWFNLAGDAINMTQRAMDFGDESHIICTDEASSLLRHIEGVNDLLNELGECEVKHGKKLQLYNYFCMTKKIGNPKRPRKAPLSAVPKPAPRSRNSSRGN